MTRLDRIRLADDERIEHVRSPSMRGLQRLRLRFEKAVPSTGPA